MSRRRRRARSSAGFTLLEVMLAIALLAMSLVIVLNIVTRNVRATNHARMVTTATFLARSKIVDVEDIVQEQGFVSDDSEEEGDFKEEGFPQFHWKTNIEKIQLPTDMMQQTQDKASEETKSTNPLEAMAGFMGGFMATLIEPICVGLEESIRRLTVKITWDEIGASDRSMEVTTFVTDPSKLDMAIGAGAAMTGAAGAGGGAAGAGGTSPQGSGTPGRATPAQGGGGR